MYAREREGRGILRSRKRRRKRRGEKTDEQNHKISERLRERIKSGSNNTDGIYGDNG